MTRKTQKKLRKLLTLVCCAVMLVCVTVGATVAYLTSQDSVTNTFTVGNVQINLDEAEVDVYGEPTGNRTETGNAYKLLPGHTYTKDPTVTVKAGSEESYIYMGVKVSNIAALKEVFPKHVNADGIFLLEDFVDDDSSVWTVKEFDDATSTYIFLYNGTVNTLNNQDLKLPALFNEIEIPGDVDNANLTKLSGLEIKVGAFAIQADGMDDATARPQAKAAFADMFN